MIANSYELSFRGYWRAPNVGGLPDESGLYCVYACTHNRKKKTVTLKELLYIGESFNIRDRVINHERWDEWENRLEWDQVLCFTAAQVSPREDRERVEAAMIYSHKPICNVEYRHMFPFETTKITTSGRNALLRTNVTVKGSSY